MTRYRRCILHQCADCRARPLQKGWQMVSAHHRALATQRTKLKTMPRRWVRDLDDAAAYMPLVTSNCCARLIRCSAVRC
jgi:hypothetical protein